ncbi:tellurite resistance TerB family protein [Pseudotabrizicola sp.]|uniref:tellurite resistance TerB family protein n=1 Tax=Pseudotabrizicola sp. TaxID=2939647 RepID=UPI002729E65E|nr:tellurite resistance TerB family protein [Pseudotabrizicola sp.]
MSRNRAAIAVHVLRQVKALPCSGKASSVGLFTNLRTGAGGVSPVEAPARGILTMVMLIAAADGRVEATSIKQVVNMCSDSPLFHAIGRMRTHEIVQDILVKLRSQGADACLAEARVLLTSKQVETAMCFAVRTAMADGHIDDAALNKLAAMGERMGLPFDSFEEIVAVMQMLQRAA